jgi:hypothetical protein
MVMMIDIDALILDAFANGWAWSVYTSESSQGALDWGIEPDEETAVKRIEYVVSHKAMAKFAIYEGGGIERTCIKVNGKARWLGRRQAARR